MTPANGNRQRPENWTRDQLLIALRLYVHMPYGRLHRGNPEIQSIARLIGRVPGGLSAKAQNFASLDPNSIHRGFVNTGQATRDLWAEFTANPEAIAAEAEEEFERLSRLAVEPVPQELQIPQGETEVERLVRTRRVQSFFRDAVLVSYNSRCALSGLAQPELLNASHIIAWSESVERRADPTNGICLNALFDRAFDRGLLTFDDNLRCIISRRLAAAAEHADLHCSILEAEGRQLQLPERFRPDLAAIAWHRGSVFGG